MISPESAPVITIYLPRQMILCGEMPAQLDSTLEPQGSHRYGIVLAVALAAVVFLIVAPEASWSRAIGLRSSGGMLLAVIATSRGNVRLRQSASVALIAVTSASCRRRVQADRAGPRHGAQRGARDRDARAARARADVLLRVAA